jgi:hypothetical protein
MVDKKGAKLYNPEPIGMLQKRKEIDLLIRFRRQLRRLIK